MTLAAGAFEFIILSSSPIEAVAGLAQRCPLQARLSLVVNRERFVRVRAGGNRCNLHLGDIARWTADLLPDLAEGVQIFEFDRYLLQLGRLAHPGKRGAGEQLAQRLPLFRACAGIDIVSNEASLDRLAYDLLNELAGEPILHAVQLHIAVLSVVNLTHREELA